MDKKSKRKQRPRPDRKNRVPKLQDFSDPTKSWNDENKPMDKELERQMEEYGKKVQRMGRFFKRFLENPSSVAVWSVANTILNDVHESWPGMKERIDKLIPKDEEGKQAEEEGKKTEEEGKKTEEEGKRTEEEGKRTEEEVRKKEAEDTLEEKYADYLELKRLHEGPRSSMMLPMENKKIKEEAKKKQQRQEEDLEAKYQRYIKNMKR